MFGFLSEEEVRERSRRRLPGEAEAERFAPGVKAIKDLIYAKHPSDIDTDVYVQAKLGEYSTDRSRIIVHTELSEDDISPFRPKSAEYIWYGAGVLDAESGEILYLDEDLYYRGNKDIYKERPHDAVLDHSGSRMLSYGDRLTIRKIPEGDVKELARGIFLYACFLDDDRYVMCMDGDSCARIFDTVTGLSVM